MVSHARSRLKYVDKHGQGFKPPSTHGIRVKYLNYYVGKINEDLEEHRVVKKLQCTIMTDGWTNR